MNQAMKNGQAKMASGAVTRPAVNPSRQLAIFRFAAYPYRSA